MMELPNFDEMSPKQIREWGNELARHASEWGEMVATLKVNCASGRTLAGLGIEYDESRSALANLVWILTKLVDQNKSKQTKISFLHDEQERLINSLLGIRMLAAGDKHMIASERCAAIVHSVDEIVQAAEEGVISS